MFRLQINSRCQENNMGLKQLIFTKHKHALIKHGHALLKTFISWIKRCTIQTSKHTQIQKE